MYNSSMFIILFLNCIMYLIIF